MYTQDIQMLVLELLPRGIDNLQENGDETVSACKGGQQHKLHTSRLMSLKGAALVSALHQAQRNKNTHRHEKARILCRNASALCRSFSE